MKLVKEYQYDGWLNHTIAAGPCSVTEQTGPDSLYELARTLSTMGVTLLRGGLYKPRTSPYSFQGLGHYGLEILYSAARSHKMECISEVIDPSYITQMYDYIDIFQVGARNMYNYELLRELGKQDKPVLLKRNFSATLSEFLYAAEYILAYGNNKVILCERGIRTFDTTFRFTTDVNAIMYLKEHTQLPVFIDPSHSTGYSSYVMKAALAGIAAGADGMIVEVDHHPDRSPSDAAQILTPEEFRKGLTTVQEVRKCLI